MKWNDKPKPNRLFTIMSLLRFLIFVGCVASAGKEANFASGSRQWPTVTGCIIKREIQHIKPTKAFQPERDEPYIKYRYKVNGKTYEADRIHFGGEATTDAQAVLAEYSTNRATVHYDPKHPDIACLSTDINYTSIAGTLLIGCSMLWLIKLDHK